MRLPRASPAQGRSRCRSSQSWGALGIGRCPGREQLLCSARGGRAEAKEQELRAANPRNRFPAAPGNSRAPGRPEHSTLPTRARLPWTGHSSSPLISLLRLLSTELSFSGHWHRTEIPGPSPGPTGRKSLLGIAPARSIPCEAPGQECTSSRAQTGSQHNLSCGSRKLQAQLPPREHHTWGRCSGTELGTMSDGQESSCV